MINPVQAYTIQLELEVTHLKEENAKLKRQNEEVDLFVRDDLGVPDVFILSGF